MVERSGGEGLDRLDAKILGSNLAYCMDVWPGFSLPCCPAELEALRRDDPPPVQEITSNVKVIYNVQKVNCNRDRFKDLTRTTEVKRSYISVSAYLNKHMVRLTPVLR
jgi:hypothetical protein